MNDGTASFIARGQKPNRFNFNLATPLKSDEKVRLEFYVITMRKKRKKLVAIFELMLQALIESKYIDLSEENLSDPSNNLLAANVQLKFFYTSPDLNREQTSLGVNADGSPVVDWMSTFDDEGRHGGHRHRQVHSKRDHAL